MVSLFWVRSTWASKIKFHNSIFKCVFYSCQPYSKFWSVSQILQLFWINEFFETESEGPLNSSVGWTFELMYDKEYKMWYWMILLGFISSLHQILVIFEKDRSDELHGIPMNSVWRNMRPSDSFLNGINFLKRARVNNRRRNYTKVSTKVLIIRS